MMKCAHAEKLIPLFAGGDLPPREIEALQAHLDSCADCRRLAAEFEESRDWIAGFAPPQFDEASLDGLRDSVLGEIRRSPSPRMWAQWLIPGWNLRFATSMAAALLIAILAAYAYRGRQPHPGTTIADKDRHGRNDRSPEQQKSPASSFAPTTNSTGQPQRNHRRGPIEKPRAVPIQLPIQPRMDVALVRAPAQGEPKIGPPVSAPKENSDVAVAREMTRIEFQTADPNIRIIWLTPKDSNASTPKPNTNAQ
jgi:hypothetical protein